MKYIKSSYKWQLRVVVVLNISIFWGVFTSGLDFSAIANTIESLSLEHGAIGILATIGTFILDGQFSADAKARLVFWRYRNPLPACRAFSYHLSRELRADQDRLLSKWGPFPTDPLDQNKLWYRIYKCFEQEVRVNESHRAWLFSRDLTAFAVLFLIILGFAAVISDAKTSVALSYTFALMVQWLTVTIAAKNYGVRFVRTVLTIASQSEFPAGNGK